MATTMAQSLAHSNLVPLDVDMEISSDAGRNVTNDDIDIDIDIEEYRDDAILDENMFDEASDERLHNVPHSPNRDDVMADEDGLDPAHGEGTMDDEFVIEDEELEDANINDIKDTDISEAQEITQADLHTTSVAEVVQINNANSNHTTVPDPVLPPTHHDVDASAASLISETHHSSDNSHIGKGESQVEINPLESISDEATNLTGQTAVDSSNAGVDSIDGEANFADEDLEKELPKDETHKGQQEDSSTLFQKQYDSNEDKSDENWNEEQDEEETGHVDDDSNKEKEKGEQGEETSLDEAGYDNLNDSNELANPVEFSPRHPVIVVYDEEEIYLIPPSNGDAEKPFLLSEPSLLDGPIHDLLTACRDILGEDIDQSLELEIDIPDLRLVISEDSHDGVVTRFSDILDVYVGLCHNDGIEIPSPLYIALSAKPRFAPRLTELRHASEQGIGLSVMRELHESDSADDAEHGLDQAGDPGSGNDEYHETSQISDGYATTVVDEQPNVELNNKGYDAPETDGKNASSFDLSKSFRTDDEREGADVAQEETAVSPHPTGASASQIGHEDELLDFGDAADDTDLAEDNTDKAAIQIESGYEHTERTNISIKVGAEDVLEEGEDEEAQEDFGEDELNYDDLEDNQESLEGEIDNVNGQVPDEEWYEDEFGEEQERDGDEHAQADDLEPQPELELGTSTDVFNTDNTTSDLTQNTVSAEAASTETQTLSHKRSREEADFEHEISYHGLETKKARPT